MPYRVFMLSPVRLSVRLTGGS